MAKDNIASAELRNKGRTRVVDIGDEDNGDAVLDVVKERPDAKVVARLGFTEAERPRLLCRR
jgi:hypothetical protein